jgi:hypothetical protein
MTRNGGIQMVDPTRAAFGGAVVLADVNEVVEQPRLTVLQASEPVGDSVWTLLNEHFFTARPDVELRIYGHYSKVCDLAFARRMTNVRRFAADCLMRAVNVEAIADIPKLESLSLGIFESKDFSVLERVPSGLTVLRLSDTRSRKASLAPLNRFRSLRVLYIEGHSKDIEVLDGLRELEDVTLRSITTPDLKWLARLPRLWSLDIKLGGIRSFEGILGKESLKYLEVWQVRELRDIGVVAVLPRLQNVFLQSLPHVTSLPTLRRSQALRRVVLENLKGLRDLTALETAPALEEFALVQGNKQVPEDLIPVLNNPTVRRVSAHFGSDRKNQAFSRLREAHGKSEWASREPFGYR